MAKDYYNLLGVEKTVSQEELKKSFRKLAHKYHPDKATGDEAKFKEINEAYQVLGDEKKRQQYDQFGAGFEQQGGFGGGMNWEDFMRASRGQGGFGGANVNFNGVDLGDIFGEMFGFGGRGGRRGAARGSDLQMDISLSFTEAVFGVEKELKLTKNSACDVCSGSGAEPGSAIKKCDECKGQGQVRRVQQTMFGAMQNVVQCGLCSGRGETPEKQCKQCGGDGVAKKENVINVKIPAGIHDGASIRLAGNGEYPGPGGQSGDLYVVVHVKKDAAFVREGNDIFTEVHISFPQAVLGDKIEITTLDGKKKLVIPPGTQSHQDFRLKGLGVPYLRGSGRGSQFVKVIVDIPKKPNKKIKKMVEELQTMIE